MSLNKQFIKNLLNNELDNYSSKKNSVYYSTWNDKKKLYCIYIYIFAFILNTKNKKAPDDHKKLSRKNICLSVCPFVRLEYHGIWCKIKVSKKSYYLGQVIDEILGFLNNLLIE